LYNYYHEIPINIGVKWVVFMNGAVFTFSVEAGLVCKMEIDKRKAKFTSDYEEKIHYLRSFSSKRESSEKP
jgi:hypothetical protein